MLQGSRWKLNGNWMPIKTNMKSEPELDWSADDARCRCYTECLLLPYVEFAIFLWKSAWGGDFCVFNLRFPNILTNLKNNAMTRDEEIKLQEDWLSTHKPTTSETDRPPKRIKIYQLPKQEKEKKKEKNKKPKKSRKKRKKRNKECRKCPWKKSKSKVAKRNKCKTCKKNGGTCPYPPWWFQISSKS